MAINIEDIMSEIRSDIQEKGLNSSMLSFADVPCDANPENPTDAYDPDTLQQCAVCQHTIPDAAIPPVDW